MSLVDRLFRIDGDVAVVNGGAGRIGSQLCHVLADAGASVVCLDLDRDRAQLVAQDVVSATSGKCISLSADTTSRDSLTQAIAGATAAVGPPSILVNATQYRGSGFYGSDPADHPLNAWNKVLEVNLTGVLLACQEFGRAMISHGGGRIVNLSSTYGVGSADPRIYGESGVNSPVSYAASKAGVLNLTRYLAVHWREHNVRVNCLVPGGVFDNQDEEFVRRYCARTPLGRMARADDYQGAVLFMVSEASSYMTGAMVTVDGGWTAW